MFLTALRSIAARVNWSRAQESVPLLASGLLLKAPVVSIPQARSTLSGRESHKELTRGSSGTSEIQIERIASLRLERDKFASSFSNAKQRLREVEQKHHSVKVRERTYVGTVGLQALEARILKTEKMSLKNSLADEVPRCDTSRKRQLSGDILTGLYLHCVKVARRVLKSELALCAGKTSELCLFDSVRKL